MEYKAIKTLKKQVEICLRDYPSTRNSDIELTLRVWATFHQHHIVENGGEAYVKLTSLHALPREDNVKRVRAELQNVEKKYLPTVLEVAIKRGFAEDEWRVALGYATKETTGTATPEWNPPSFRTKPTGERKLF